MARCSNFTAPCRKRIARRITKRCNQLPQPGPALDDRFYKRAQSLPVIAPFRRNITPGLANYFRVKLLNAGKPGLKRFPSGHMRIDIIPIVDTMQCQLRKGPLTRIETVSLVDETGVVFPVPGVSPEDGLAAISVSQPLVQRKNSRKRLWLSNSLKHAFRQVVEDLPLKWVTHVARPELQP